MKTKYWDVWRAIKQNTQELSHNELASLFRKSALGRLQFAALDSRYWAVDLKTWQLILAYNGTDLEPYQSERYDCDSFSVSLSGEVGKKWKLNTCGIVIDFSARHAYNCVVTTDAGILVVEPQSDQIFNQNSPYEAQSGFVMFA